MTQSVSYQETTACYPGLPVRSELSVKARPLSILCMACVPDTLLIPAWEGLKCPEDRERERGVVSSPSPGWNVRRPKKTPRF